VCWGDQQPKERSSDDPLEFLKGFLEGLNEKGNVNKLVKCLKDIDSTAKRITYALELIITKDPQEMREGIKLLVEAVLEYVNTIKPCAEEFDQIKKLLQKLQKVDIGRILTKILQSFDQYTRIINQCIGAFRKKEFKLAGKYLGQLLNKLFLADAPSPSALLNMKEFEQCLNEIMKLGVKGELSAMCDIMIKGVQGLVKENGELDEALLYKLGILVKKINKGHHENVVVPLKD